MARFMAAGHSRRRSWISSRQAIGWAVSVDIRFSRRYIQGGQTPTPTLPPELWQTSDGGRDVEYRWSRRSRPQGKGRPPLVRPEVRSVQLHDVASCAMRLAIRVCATDTASGAGPESMVIAKMRSPSAHRDACVHMPDERPSEWTRRLRSALVNLKDEGVVARATGHRWIHLDPIARVGDVVRLVLLMLRRHPSSAFATEPQSPTSSVSCITCRGGISAEAPVSR